MSLDEEVILLGSDLMLTDRLPDAENQFRIYTPLGADLQFSKKKGDMEVTSDEMNLAQAIMHRLRTAKGELKGLGHPEYGSTILDFIGLPNNWATRERLRLAIRDAIRQEVRVKELRSVTVNPRVQILGEESQTPTNSDPIISDNTTKLLNSVDVEVIIVPIGSMRPILIAFPINLEVI